MLGNETGRLRAVGMLEGVSFLQKRIARRDDFATVSTVRTMETPLHLPDHESPSAIAEVLIALRQQDFEARHDKKAWGDWIQLAGHQTVISIESNHGLSRMATLEASEDDDDDVAPRILAAFGKLGWYGSDEDGPYPLG